METVRKWEPVDGVGESTELSVHFDGDGLSILLSFDHSCEPEDRNLLIIFDDQIGVAIHDEVAHPWVGSDIVVPKGSGGRGFPLLRVEGSTWLRDLDDYRRGFRDDWVHYRICVLNEVVDVVAGPEPTVRWVVADDGLRGAWRKPADKTFYKHLWPERGPETCRAEGCSRLRIDFSVKCALHHFIVIAGYDPKVERDGGLGPFGDRPKP